MMKEKENTLTLLGQSLKIYSHHGIINFKVIGMNRTFYRCLEDDGHIKLRDKNILDSMFLFKGDRRIFQANILKLPKNTKLIK